MLKELGEKCPELTIILTSQKVRKVGIATKIMKLRSNVGVHRHSKRKWFSSSMFIFSQRWQILSTHGVLGTSQRHISLCSSWEFVLILAILIFFLGLIKTERYFWSSRVGLSVTIIKQWRCPSCKMHVSCSTGFKLETRS